MLEIPDEMRLFNDARRIEGRDARRQYLTRACGEDATLIARVEALLRVHESDLDFLANPASVLLDDSPNAPIGLKSHGRPTDLRDPGVGSPRTVGRRTRTAMLAPAFVLLLLATTALSIWQMIRANNAERRATLELSRAETSRQIARQALDKLTDAAVDRLMKRPGGVTVADSEFLREVLTSYGRLAEAGGDSREDRVAVAAAHDRIGMIHRRLGELASAETSLGKAVELRRQLLVDYPDCVEYRRDLSASYIRLAGVLRDTGRLLPAEKAGVTAIELLQSLPDDRSNRHELAAAQLSLATTLTITNRTENAEQALRSTVDVAENLASAPGALPADRQLLAKARQNLGNLQLQAGRFGPAEKCYLAAREDLKKLLTEFPDDADYRADLARVLGNIGALFAHTRRQSEAKEAFCEATDQLRKLTAEYPNHIAFRSLLADNHLNLGNLLTRMKAFSESEANYAAARADLERLVAELPNVAEYRASLAKAVAGLALLKALAKDFVAARDLIAQAIQHDLAVLRIDPAHPAYREACRTHRGLLTEVLGSLGEHDAAAEIADELARLAYEPAADSFTAARIIARCGELARTDSRLTEGERREVAKSYDDRAVAHLKEAINRGFRDGDLLLNEPAFNRLRSRNDFKAIAQRFNSRPATP